MARTPGTYATIETNQGTIVCKLFDKDAPIIRGSATKALEGDADSEQAILDLVKAMDESIPEPKRELDKPFLMPIEDVLSIKGRGTVVTGSLRGGRQAFVP